MYAGRFFNRQEVKKQFTTIEICELKDNTALLTNIDNYFNSVVKTHSGYRSCDINRCIIFIKHPHRDILCFVERNNMLNDCIVNTKRHSFILYGSYDIYDKVSLSRKREKKSPERKAITLAKHINTTDSTEIARIAEIIAAKICNHWDYASTIKDLVKFDDAVDRLKKIQNLSERKTDYYMLRYGNIDKYTEIQYRASFVFKNCRNYWISRDYEDVDELVSEHQREMSGRVQDHTSPRSIAFWLAKGKSEEEAGYIVKTIQTRNLQFFLNRYGEAGYMRYQQMKQTRAMTNRSKSAEEKTKINKSKGRAFSQLADTYGIDNARDIIYRRTHTGSRYSRESADFFTYLDDILCIDDSVTGYKGKEWFVLHDNGIYFVDYKYRDKIIEYNGSFWHADPTIFNADDIHPVSQITALSIWKTDEDRLCNIRAQGFDIKVIWSSDIITKGVDIIIEECRKFLKGI